MFKARKMPDYSIKEHLTTPKKTTQTPFQLSTEIRGDSKVVKLQELIENERQENLNRSQFKSTPIRCNMNNNAMSCERVKSDKKLTKPIGLSLASQERSVSRELFEQVKKEKQMTQERDAEEQAKVQGLLEAEEVKKLRAKQVFKANPIRHYSLGINSSSVTRKELTQP